jgi:hypothetical protein
LKVRVSSQRGHRAFSVRGKALAPDVLEAGFVVGELAQELQQVTRRFRGRGASRIEAVNRGTCLLLVGKSASEVAAFDALAFPLSMRVFAGQSDSKHYARWDSNPRPPTHDGGALSTELRA